MVDIMYDEQTMELMNQQFKKMFKKKLSQFKNGTSSPVTIITIIKRIQSISDAATISKQVQIVSHPDLKIRAYKESKLSWAQLDRRARIIAMIHTKISQIEDEIHRKKN